MRGRDLFKRARLGFVVIGSVVSLFPLRLREWLYGFFSNFSGVFFVGVRYVLLKSLCRQVGENVFVDKDVYIRNFEGLSIGSNVSIHKFSYVDAIGGISIGNDVSIAHCCSLVSFNHDWSSSEVKIRDASVVLKEIVIGNDVWIGCGVRLLAGASVGNRCVVGAGAVVTESLASGAIYGGVPARFLKEC